MKKCRMEGCGEVHTFCPMCWRAFDVAFSDIWAAGSMSLHRHQPMGGLSVCIAKSLEIAYFCSI